MIASFSKFSDHGKKYLHQGDQDVEGLRKEGDGRTEFDLHDGVQGALGISGRGKGRGANVEIHAIICQWSSKIALFKISSFFLARI